MLAKLKALMTWDPIAMWDPWPTQQSDQTTSAGSDAQRCWHEKEFLPADHAYVMEAASIGYAYSEIHDRNIYAGSETCQTEGDDDMISNGFRNTWGSHVAWSDASDWSSNIPNMDQYLENKHLDMGSVAIWVAPSDP